MNHPTVLALTPTGIGGVEKILAIAGGAALGALLSGLLTQLLCRAVTTRKVPRGVLFLIRLLGAVVCGWLVALWVFGGGGGGLGGPGGSGFGAGAGKGTQQPAGEGEKKREEDRRPDKGTAGLRVEVLGDPALKRVAAGNPVDPNRRYRVEGKEGLMTLSEVEQLIEQRRTSAGLRRLDIILYNDSPARNVLYVARLEEWARNLPVGENETIKVDVVLRDEDAPTR
jgi:hypothetical protein